MLTSKKENPLVEVLIRCPVPGKEENCTLLASWPYGLGKTVAFTTDSGFSFANQWTGWEDYDKLFGQMVRWAMRPVDEEGKFTVATDFKDGKVRVVVTALDKNDEFQNFLDMSATAVSPELKPIDLRMEQTAPGRYVGEFPAADPGSYMVMLSPGTGKAPLRTGINVPYSDEFRGLATNETLLDRLAKLVPKGGAAGRLIDAPEEFQERRLRQAPGRGQFPPRPEEGHQQPGRLVLRGAGGKLPVVLRRLRPPGAGERSLGQGLGLPAAAKAGPGRGADHRAAAEPQGRGGLAVGAAPGGHPLRGPRRRRRPALPGSAGSHGADSRRVPPAAPSPPSSSPKEESYTSRLLKAKKKAFEPKKE